MISNADSYCAISYAFAKLYKHVKPVPDTALVPVFDSKGYVLKEDVVSYCDIPAYSSSHMDGFALKSEETISASESEPLTFKISCGKSVLGNPSSYSLKPREVFRIQTGGYLPHQSDAVVPIESVKVVEDESVIISSPVKKGSFVYLAGADVKKKEKLLFKGKLLRAQDMAILASLKFSKVPVFKKPIVGIIPTGTELTDDMGENNNKNNGKKILNINGPMIACLTDEIGGIPLSHKVTPDNPDILKKNLKTALKDSDIVITIGGTSMGMHDIVETTINSLGKPGVLVHGVKLDRGRVSGLAVIDKKPIVLLPGPIQGALNAFIVFVRPLVRVFSGLAQNSDMAILATITEKWSARKKFPNFTKIVYVKVLEKKGDFLATPLTGETHSVSLLVKSNGYVVISEEVTNIDAGEKVKVNLLPGFSYTKDGWV
jgi:molybdenum cofactor synthesis domain-containing protein